MLRAFVTLIVAVLLAACTSTPAPPATAVADLAPTGTLRAVINYGNPTLAREEAPGRPVGVSVDLARELATRLGVEASLVTVTSAGEAVDLLAAGTVDAGFFAPDPVRAATTTFTAPYLQIEGAYLVRDNSPITANEHVDRPSVRIAVDNRSAYDLYLTRELKHATIERAPTSPAVVDYFLTHNLDVAASVRQQLEMDARRVPGLRLLPGRFMVINQAMGLPRGKDAGAAFLSSFVEDVKASGFVAAALARHGIDGVVVARRSILN